MTDYFALFSFSSFITPSNVEIEKVESILYKGCFRKDCC